jgi:hypothetical protein
MVIVHRCTGCGAERANRVAGDDAAQPDDIDAIIAVMTNSAAANRLTGRGL